MEVTLKKSLVSFKSTHPSVKISWRTFNCLHPKNIWLVQCVERLQCVGMYHTNIDYVRNICYNLLLINGKDTAFSSNEALVAKAVCDIKSLKCILGQSAQCIISKNAPLKHLELWMFQNFQKRKCYYQAHNVKVRQWKHQEYFYKDEKNYFVWQISPVGRIGCITEEQTGTFLRSSFQYPTYLWSVCRVIDDYSILKIHYKTTHLPLTRWDSINPLDSRNSCSVSDFSFVKRWYSLRSSNFHYWQ